MSFSKSAGPSIPAGQRRLWPPCKRTIKEKKFFNNFYTRGGFYWTLAFIPNTPAYRARRRLFERNFRSSVAPKYQDRQVQATIKMLRNFLRTPDQFSAHTHQYVFLKCI